MVQQGFDFDYFSSKATLLGTLKKHRFCQSSSLYIVSHKIGFLTYDDNIGKMPGFDVDCFCITRKDIHHEKIFIDSW